MEAFALLKIEKNKKIAAEKEALEKHRIAERTIKSTKQSVSIDESKRLVRSLNQCIPPYPAISSASCRYRLFIAGKKEGEVVTYIPYDMYWT